MKVHFVNLAWRIRTRPTSPGHDTSTDTEREPRPGMIWNVECAWAHVRDGCVVYARVGKPDLIQYVPIANLYAFTIDDDPAPGQEG